MTAQQVKADYSALPTRILGNPAFTALDLRVLGVVAWHDRFGRNGRGCFASNKTIGARAGCHANSAGRAVTRLLKLGAISDLNASLNRKRSRRRMLVIVYRDEDLERLEVNPSVDFEPGHEANRAAPREVNHKPAKPLSGLQEPKISARSQPAKKSTHTVDIREGAKAPKALDPSLEEWYRAYQASRQPRTWTPPTAASRRQIAEDAAACIRQLRFARSAPPPSRDELRERLRADIGDERFDAIPDALRANPVACAEPTRSSLRDVSRPAFEKMQLESANVMHRKPEGQRG
jgi:hypothetical protein